jgi:predicted Zn-dependent protease
LYWTAGEKELALRQARLALAARSAEAPVPLFLAGMLIEQGDRQGAARALRDARARLRPGDERGLRLLSRYEAALAQPPG